LRLNLTGPTITQHRGQCEWRQTGLLVRGIQQQRKTSRTQETKRTSILRTNFPCYFKYQLW